MQKISNTIVYLGVDIGKAEHAWTLVDRHGSILKEGKVINRIKDLRKFVRFMIKNYPSLLVACEATGSYYEKIAIAFMETGVRVVVINPALTSTKALRSSMRITKTDKQDARGIARKVQERKGDIGTVFQWNPQERRLQALARHIQFLKKQRSSLKVRVKDMNARSFKCIKVDDNLFDKQIKELEKELIEETNKLCPSQMKILLDIRGVGEISAAMILAETMCMNRFASSKAYAAFIGLDPTLKQSGTSIHGRSRMSKAGSPHLRARITWSAKLLVQWNDIFRTCFTNAISRGKAPGVAYGIVARKFATVIHQCIVNNEPFNPNKVGLGTSNLI